MNKHEIYYSNRMYMLLFLSSPLTSFYGISNHDPPIYPMRIYSLARTASAFGFLGGPVGVLLFLGAEI